MEEPLLSRHNGVAEKQSQRWNSYRYAGRAGSVLTTASLAGTEVSIGDIRSAAAFFDRYAPSVHTALVSSPQSFPNEQGLVNQGGVRGEFSGNTNDVHWKKLDEIEIRELLIDHVGHRCCLASRPARTWKIHAVEDCNVYVGTLETFIEERETVREKEPYLGGNVDGKDKGPELGIWELDLWSEFPFLFVPHKESRVKIPHSEAVERCSVCARQHYIVCCTCNADQDTGFYVENQMTTCPGCCGVGLIAHEDGADTICVKCNGKGKIPCSTCGSHGLVKCKTCQGSGSLLSHNIAVVKWRTLSTWAVSATSGAATVPDEVFRRAKGVQLCITEAYRCSPAFFSGSFFLNKFSSEVIADRAPVPPAARVIRERHTIYAVPVTRVTMAHESQSFTFYIIGFSKEVYLSDCYPSRFCMGLCKCLNWLRL